MDSARYLESLADDAALLIAAGRHDGATAVPTCPGWDLDALLWHVAVVYRHKVVCIRIGRPPDPWPPPRPSGAVADELRAAYDELTEQLRVRDPADPAFTWYPPDQTVGFWQRRMAQETAVHRVDAQLAVGVATPIAADIAADGVDEFLTMMLAPDYTDTPADAPDRTLRIKAGGREWLVTVTPRRVSASRNPAAAEPADATITGDPSTVDLWLWGRGGDTDLDVEGDPAAIEALHAAIGRGAQ
ncbi:MAG: maleylpyruvate isomerase family mycothiol-dependent enzyme [Mycobacteriales bacterium]